MKRLYFIAIMIAICSMTAMAQDRPDIIHNTGGGDHGGITSFAQQPTLVYHEDTNQIEVFGCRTDNYHVVIMLQPVQIIVWEGTIDGEYDIIDVSSLINGTYSIVLTNANGYSYTWTFDGGLSGSRLPGGVEKMSDKTPNHMLGGSPNGQKTLK